ncbi:MAG: hypothetical protein JWN73_3822 [Betaproteobacteria bacterium]|nr:hypothetical protein [Betaproteobacteria bacterium]
MSNVETRRSESGRSHADRHPGLVENLDNPHPGNRRAAAMRSASPPCSSKSAAARSAAPR